METTYIINRRFDDERCKADKNVDSGSDSVLEDSASGIMLEDSEHRSKDRRDGKINPQIFVLSSEFQLQSWLSSRHVLYECEFFATFDEN